MPSSLTRSLAMAAVTAAALGGCAMTCGARKCGASDMMQKCGACKAKKCAACGAQK